jgi:hypothetical protein
VSKRVFISYRRDDTASAAGRIYDRLCQLLSKSNVFFDVATISGGRNFETEIASAIGRSDAALIIIGDKWSGLERSTGSNRIWEPDDYVRAEVRASLARPILVLPVLVGAAGMPKPEQVPEDIRAITLKNALPLRHETFDDDAENIFAAVLGRPTRRRSWQTTGRFWPKLIYATVGGIAASALVLIGATMHFWALGRPLSVSIGWPAAALLLVAGPLLGVSLGLIYDTWKCR